MYASKDPEEPMAAGPNDSLNQASISNVHDAPQRGETSIVMFINNSVMQNSLFPLAEHNNRSVLALSILSIENKKVKTGLVAFGVFMILAALFLGSSVGVVSVFIPVKDPLVKMVCR